MESKHKFFVMKKSESLLYVCSFDLEAGIIYHFYIFLFLHTWTQQIPGTGGRLQTDWHKEPVSDLQGLVEGQMVFTAEAHGFSLSFW